MAMTVGEQHYQAQVSQAIQAMATSLARLTLILESMRMTLQRIEQKQRC